MPDVARCSRCGRITVTGFVLWHLTDRGQAICPHCRTPDERGHDTALPADDPDEQLLRDLDPDHGG